MSFVMYNSGYWSASTGWGKQRLDQLLSTIEDFLQTFMYRKSSSSIWMFNISRDFYGSHQFDDILRMEPWEPSVILSQSILLLVDLRFFRSSGPTFTNSKTQSIIYIYIYSYSPVQNVHVYYPSRHGLDFHLRQSQINIVGVDFHLRQSQICLLGQNVWNSFV